MANTKNNQQPYFPHSANLRNNDKLVRLRMQHGVAGYGVYIMLLERLRIAEDFRGNLDFKVMSWDLGCDEELIQSVIFDFDLFNLVCDGSKFESIELNSYMEFMEASRRKRVQAARAAANARWGNAPSDDSEIADNNIKAEKTQEPVPELTEAQRKDSQKLTLEEEALQMKADQVWLDNVNKWSNKTQTEIKALIDEFFLFCLCFGKEGGHINYGDAKKHFCSWMAKRHLRNGESQYDSADKPLSYSKRIHNKEAIYQENRNKERELREAEHEQMRTQKTTAENYIRNNGYDPNVVRLANIMNPNWRESNPPTHPEWIGKYGSMPVSQKQTESADLHAAI